MVKRGGLFKLIRARRWPRGLSDKKLAEFVATHDLSELIDRGRSAKAEFTHQALEQTKSKREERLRGWAGMMKTVSAEIKKRYLSRRARVLLGELQEVCQRVLKLLAQLEALGLTEKQVDEILGELSALVVHLHGHTQGLDEVIDRDRVAETR